MKKYWYKIQIIECPLCGSIDKFKERIYGKKPKNPEKRYKYKQEYDYCER